MMTDLKYAVRMLRKSPGFTFVAVITLALGIGANTAIFSVINAVLLQPLPYPDADRIMSLNEFSGGTNTSMAFPDYIDWRRDNTVFEHLAISRRESRNLSGIQGREPERVGAAYVTANFFKVIGCRRNLAALLPTRKTKLADLRWRSSTIGFGSAFSKEIPPCWDVSTQSSRFAPSKI